MTKTPTSYEFFENALSKQEVEFRLRGVLSDWPLYTPQDHVQITRVPQQGPYCVQYCGFDTDRPFTAGMRLDDNPPNYLSMNIKPDGTLYLLFIQLRPELRGRGYGARLYDLVCDFAFTMGCHQVQQYPSGGYSEQSRYEYLLKRGWHDCPADEDNGEVMKGIHQWLQPHYARRRTVPHGWFLRTYLPRITAFDEVVYQRFDGPKLTLHISELDLYDRLADFDKRHPTEVSHGPASA